MDEIAHFVPGVQDDRDDMLARLRWPVPAGVATTYVEAYTAPGDLVLVPYCQGPGLVLEIAALGRRVLAVNFDPLLALLAQVTLAPPAPRDLDAAVTRLGDSPKQELPLRRYLAELYATTCPACLRPVIADYFVWDREVDQPVAKQVRCPACSWDGQAAAGAEDRERAAAIPRRGLHYHYVLERVLPRRAADPALRARLEALLDLYSTRNLYALAELTIKLEGLFPQGSLRLALQLLLAGCLDRGSGLPAPTTTAGGAPRGRSLARPARFVEHNVWLAFEDAAARLRAAAAAPLPAMAPSVESLLSGVSGGLAFAGQGLVRALPQVVPARSLALVLSSPPPLSANSWTLSYFWGAWLLGDDAVAPLRSLVRQRQADTDLYARVMAGSLSRLAGLLRDDGHLVLVVTGQRPPVIGALALAAASARLRVTRLLQAGGDYRLELSPALQRAEGSQAALGSPPAAVAPAALRQAALDAALAAIQAAGEPLPWRALHAAAYRRLADTGLLAATLPGDEGAPSPLDLIAEQVRFALDDPLLERLPAARGEEEMWWPARPADPEPPLSDRVEAVARELLGGHPGWRELDLVRAIYARFPGGLAPDPALVSACLQSYGRQEPDGRWHLRPEDEPEAREAEKAGIVAGLVSLGQRLGYRAEPAPPFDLAWYRGKWPRALFAVRWQAALHETLSLPAPTARAQRYLVVPGGRAALVEAKLARHPLWQRALDEGRWLFIKYRHVRELAAEADVDEYTLRTIVGLDPIVERDVAQLPLF